MGRRTGPPIRAIGGWLHRGPSGGKLWAVGGRVKQPVIILDKPQLAENIGAAARVMANFGLDELRLVAPRDGWPQDRAWASASGANWPLDDARVFPTLEEAMADLQLVLATTARP